MRTLARVPGGFGINDVRGVRSRPSRAVSLDDARNPESVADAMFLAQVMAEQEGEGWLDPSQERSLRTAVDVVRPMQLRDLGIAGLMGMVPLPLPGAAGKAGRTVAGKADDAARGLVNFLRRGDDVVDDVADLVQPRLPGMERMGRTAAGPAAPPRGGPIWQRQRSRNTVAPPGSPAQELFPPHVEGLAAMGRGPGGRIGNWGRSDFHRDAMRGSVRGSRAQNPAAAHLSIDNELFDQMAEVQNHVGMGRLSNFTEADIKHWYLLQEAEKRGIRTPVNFSERTGRRVADSVEQNRAIIRDLSDEAVDAAEAAYLADAAAYEQAYGAAFTDRFLANNPGWKVAEEGL